MLVAEILLVVAQPHIYFAVSHVREVKFGGLEAFFEQTYGLVVAFIGWLSVFIASTVCLTHFCFDRLAWDKWLCWHLTPNIN